MLGNLQNEKCKMKIAKWSGAWREVWAGRMGGGSDIRRVSASVGMEGAEKLAFTRMYQ